MEKTPTELVPAHDDSVDVAARCAILDAYLGGRQDIQKLLRTYEVGPSSVEDLHESLQWEVGGKHDRRNVVRDVVLRAAVVVRGRVASQESIRERGPVDGIEHDSEE